MMYFLLGLPWPSGLTSVELRCVINASRAGAHRGAAVGPALPIPLQYDLRLHDGPKRDATFTRGRT